jgi:hypothetical protein
MIRLLTSIAGAPAHHAGDIVTLSPELETAWVSHGYAERVGDQVEHAVTGAAPEIAMRQRKGRRGV